MDACQAWPRVDHPHGVRIACGVQATRGRSAPWRAGAGLYRFFAMKRYVLGLSAMGDVSRWNLLSIQMVSGGYRELALTLALSRKRERGGRQERGRRLALAMCKKKP